MGASRPRARWVHSRRDRQVPLQGPLSRPRPPAVDAHSLSAFSVRIREARLGAAGDPETLPQALGNHRVSGRWVPTRGSPEVRSLSSGPRPGLSFFLPGKSSSWSQLPSPGGPEPGSHAGEERGSKRDSARGPGSGLGGPPAPEGGELTRGGRQAAQCRLQRSQDPGVRTRGARPGRSSPTTLAPGGGVGQPGAALRPPAHGRASWSRQGTPRAHSRRGWRPRPGFTATSARWLLRRWVIPPPREQTARIAGLLRESSLQTYLGAARGLRVSVCVCACVRARARVNYCLEVRFLFSLWLPLFGKQWAWGYNRLYASDLCLHSVGWGASLWHLCEGHRCNVFVWFRVPDFMHLSFAHLFSHSSSFILHLTVYLFWSKPEGCTSHLMVTRRMHLDFQHLGVLSEF